MSKVYSIQFNGPGLDYLRQVLGTRPHDEVGLLIRSIEQQRNEQDNPPPAMPPAASADAPATGMLPGGIAPASLNGSGESPVAVS